MDDRSLQGKYLRLREELRRAANPSYAKRLREEIERIESRLAQISQPFADTLLLAYVPGRTEASRSSRSGPRHGRTR